MRLKFRSLRFRITAAFGIMGALLLGMYGITTYATVAEVEDRYLEKAMWFEAAAFVEDLQKYGFVDMMPNKYSSVYVGTGDMPPEIFIMIGGLGPGHYETSGPGGIGGPEDMYFQIMEILDRDELLYLVYNMRELGVIKERAVGLVFVVGFMFTALLGVLMSFLAAKRIIRPLKRLGTMVASSDPMDTVKGFSNQFDNDEIGYLADVVDGYMARIREFLLRERAFTREASHELRTPVTVISGAVELLEQDKALSPPSQRALARIRRSASDMEDIIDTFLWLAREDSTADEKEQGGAHRLAEEVLEKFKELADPNVTLSLDAEDAPPLNVPASAFRIALGNLLGNALKHTLEGSVTISLHPDRISVIDTGSGIPDELRPKVAELHVRDENSSGHGIGLSIVARLCDRFGWQFDLTPNSSGGTTATLVLGPEDKS